MGGGKRPSLQEKRCKICGKLVKGSLGLIGHMKVHNRVRDKSHRRRTLRRSPTRRWRW